MLTLQDLKLVFCDVFGNPSLQISENTNSGNLPGWDSYTHINLTVALEEKFAVSFSTDEIAKLTSVKDILSVLETKGAK